MFVLWGTLLLLLIKEFYERTFWDKDKYNAIMSALAGVVYREMRRQTPDH
jgi:type I restriction enzyme R subunit